MLCLVVTLVACKSLEDTAFKTTGTVAITATAAMSEWLDYKNTSTVPVSQVESVKDAWNKYYALSQVERQAIVAYKTNPGTNTLNLAISITQAASSDLISLIVQFLPTSRAAKLKGVK